MLVYPYLEIIFLQAFLPVLLILKCVDVSHKTSIC